MKDSKTAKSNVEQPELSIIIFCSIGESPLFEGINKAIYKEFRYKKKYEKSIRQKIKISERKEETKLQA